MQSVIPIVSVATLFYNTLDRVYMCQLETCTIGKNAYITLHYLGRALVERLLIITPSLFQNFADRLFVSISLHFFPMLMARIHRVPGLGFVLELG